MEIFQDLLFTISFSLVVSLILAKLFSLSSSSDDEDKCWSSSKSALSEEISKAESLACDFEKQDSGKVHVFEEKAVDYDKIENDEFMREVEDVVLEEIDREENVFNGRERQYEGEKEERESVGGDDVLAEQVFDEITERSKLSEIEVEPVECDMVEIVDDDDGWEGIERTELEKIFWSGVTFLGSNNSNADRVSAISNEVKMQLYGLNKVATQGPCCKPQPMAIKVSARANWNAWKRVGNISPEEAMEQYLALLTQHVPDWMENDSGNGKRDHLVNGITGQPPSYIETHTHTGSEMKGQTSKQRDEKYAGCFPHP